MNYARITHEKEDGISPVLFPPYFLRISASFWLTNEEL